MLWIFASLPDCYMLACLLSCICFFCNLHSFCTLCDQPVAPVCCILLRCQCCCCSQCLCYTLWPPVVPLLCVWLFIEVPMLLLLLCAIVCASFEAVMNASTLMYSDMPKCMLKFLWWLSFFSYQKCGCTFGLTDTHILSLISVNAFSLLYLFFQFWLHVVLIFFCREFLPCFWSYLTIWCAQLQLDAWCLLFGINDQFFVVYNLLL